jgi:phage terminase large subunit-like protein
VFPPTAYGDRWHVVPRLFCPADGIRTRSRKDGVPYDRWVDEGHLIATEGNVIDYAFIRAAIHHDAERFRVKRIAFDRWNSTHLVQELQGDGFEMVGFGQGYASMAAPVREIEKLVRGQELAHGGHPVLRWMVSNIAPSVDPAGNTKFDKGRSGDKIDGAVAMAMALGIAIADEVKGPSVYETRGVLTL